MNLLHFLSKSRGVRNLASRIRVALVRFGISSRKFEYLLSRYNNVTHELGYRPTFAITAATLNRHPDFIKELDRQGVEFAIHGYQHLDYTTISWDEQDRHYKKAIDIFKINEIPFVGFRAPFLRPNGHTPEVLSNLGFSYDSSFVIQWNEIDLSKCSRNSKAEYERLIRFYQPRNADRYLSVPRFKDGLIEIPVSIPDDEAIVDRLCITDRNKISHIWMSILEQTYDRGEIFTLQLHPERILHCEDSLVNVIKRARDFHPPVWIARLREITEWWQERSKFIFEIIDQGDGRYRVKATCSDRATVLIKNLKVNVPVSEWFDGYQSLSARDFIIESPKRPVIGIGQDSSPAAVSFLHNEGYIVEESNQPDDYEIYLNNLAQFDEADEKSLYNDIEQRNAPLLKYWRWPDQTRSALSITGDIDSMTLTDFVLRIYENFRQNRR